MAALQHSPQTLLVPGSAPAPVTVATMATILVAVPVIASLMCSTEEQVLSSNSSPKLPAPVAPPRGTPGSYLMEENERLRRENSRLVEELRQMKYSAGQRAPKEAPPMSVSTELELMQVVEVFGVVRIQEDRSY